MQKDFIISPKRLPDCLVVIDDVNENRGGHTRLARDIELIHVPRVRDCFVFFNFDVFGAKPIDN
jgi:hypothetical protein